MDRDAIQRAATIIRSADALLIGAGAGMGVDSGLPDFRGPEGFWRAYPVFQGKQFAEISTPHWFHTDPALAWGFFGHRLSLYRTAVPHVGFRHVLVWAAEMPYGAFVFTSNVDGQFQKAGFADQAILECHGSIHHLQCTACSRPIWSADAIAPQIDESTFRAREPFPACPDCGAMARPNILMFNDYDWNSARADAQSATYRTWLQSVQRKNVVAIELGAGTAIPTVRLECEEVASTVIRINVRDADAPRRGVAIAAGAAAALTAIAEELQGG